MSLSIRFNQIKPNYTNVITNSPQKNANMEHLTNTVLTGNAEGSSFLSSPDMSTLTRTVLGGGNGNTQLSDYAAIKNGSYGKLIKAYYKEVGSSDASAIDTEV